MCFYLIAGGNQLCTRIAANIILYCASTDPPCIFVWFTRKSSRLSHASMVFGHWIATCRAAEQFQALEMGCTTGPWSDDRMHSKAEGLPKVFMWSVDCRWFQPQRTESKNKKFGRRCLASGRGVELPCLVAQSFSCWVSYYRLTLGSLMPKQRVEAPVRLRRCFGRRHRGTVQLPTVFEFDQICTRNGSAMCNLEDNLPQPSCITWLNLRNVWLFCFLKCVVQVFYILLVAMFESFPCRRNYGHFK